MTVRHRYIDEELYVPKASTSLIVGTFPSVLIRQINSNLRPCDVNFYYGSSDNFLWTDLEKIYSRTFSYNWANNAVSQRKQLLDSLKLAITDIIIACDTDGGTSDDALDNYVINENIISILDNNPSIIKIFFTSGSGKINAEKLTLKYLRDKKKIFERKITQKAKPTLRTFKYKSASGMVRDIESVTLYSPSPSAKRGGVTDDIRQRQYEKYLPKICT